MKSNMPTNRLHIKFLETAFLNILKYAINVHVPGYTARSKISATFVWQDKSSEKKLSGFMVYKQDMVALR